MDNTPPILSAPSVGYASAIALGCGSLGGAVAVLEGTTTVLNALPVPSSLIVFGMAAMALGIRELAVRAQFADQAMQHVSSQRELEKKIQWLQMTEAHAQVGHWRLDFATDSVYWSDATYAIHGLDPGRPPALEDALSYYHPDDRQIVADNVERARQTGQPYTFRARLVRGAGEVRYVDAGASVELGPEGQPIAMFGVIKDRTTEELMQQELRKARDDAKALARSKDAFLARMSHEIRTPMNGVLGFAELLGRTEMTSEQKRHTDLIIDSGKSLQTLLNDILDLTKIEAGKVEIKYESVDILHLVNHIVQMSEPAARAKGLKLVCDAAPEVPRHVVTDALRLRQILGNLLTNAVQFTSEGGVSLSLRCTDGQLRFSVCDTGIGISPRIHDEIFDPFAQGREDRRSTHGGTGLGLAISRQLAELMDGRLHVSSEVGEGSVFTLTLPLLGTSSPPNALRQDGPPAFPQFEENTARVLLAEDYDVNRELIAKMALQVGLEIDYAEDGVQAVSMVHHARTVRQPYHLVLMDLQMPRMDGLEATRRLRSAGITEDELPIVALTANAFADDVESCLAAGMQAHLAKPLSLEHLSTMLQKWLPQNRNGHHDKRPSISSRRG